MASTSTAAAIRLNISIIEPEYLSDTTRTVTYEENTNYDPCLCNLTSLTCDAYCCCDIDCNLDTRANWADNKKCKEISYESSANGLSLSDCITRKEVYEYNRKRGLTNYIDPFAQLFCVRFNHSPAMNYFWTDKTDLSAQEISDLRKDEEKNGFRNSFFGTTGNTAISASKEFYQLGETMKSRICIADECTSHYLDAFPIPYPNIYGMCNNYSSAAFMESESNDCTQIVDLITDCETTLNTQYFTEYLNVLAGGAPSSDKI